MDKTGHADRNGCGIVGGVWNKGMVPPKCRGVTAETSRRSATMPNHQPSAGVSVRRLTVSSDEISKLLVLFDEMDLDSSAHLSRMEVANALGELGVEIFEPLDRNEDGFIEGREWEKYHRNLKRQMGQQVFTNWYNQLLSLLAATRATAAPTSSLPGSCVSCDAVPCGYCQEGCEESACTYESVVDKTGHADRNGCGIVGGVWNKGTVPPECRGVTAEPSAQPSTVGVPSAAPTDPPTVTGPAAYTLSAITETDDAHVASVISLQLNNPRAGLSNIIAFDLSAMLPAITNSVSSFTISLTSASPTTMPASWLETSGTTRTPTTAAPTLSGIQAQVMIRSALFLDNPLSKEDSKLVAQAFRTQLGNTFGKTFEDGHHDMKGWVVTEYR